MLFRDQHDALLGNWNAFIKGYALYMGGRKQEGIEMTREAFERAATFPVYPCMSIACTFLAEPLCLEGRIDEARALAQKTLALGEHGDNFGQLMAHRVLAMAAARSRPPRWQEAEDSIQTSIRLARERRARPDEAIGRFRFAEILADMGEPARARQQLADASRAFDDMGMAWWPEQARQLAARLAAG